MTDVYVIGAGIIPFARHEASSLTDLSVEASFLAIKDSGLAPHRIDSGYFASVLGGRLFGDSTLGQSVFAEVGISGGPIVNIENACASGSSAVCLAYNALSAGQSDYAIVVGAEKMCVPGLGLLNSGESDIETKLGLVTPASFALRAQRHMYEFGTTLEQMAQVSVKNRRHAAANPLAHFRKEVTIEEVIESRPIADPLNLLDCSPVTDGSAAAILVSDRMLKRLGSGRAVRLAASTLFTGSVETEPTSMTFEPLTRKTAEAAYEKAGIGPEDVDFAEVHDCFSIAEVLRVEGLGLFPQGGYPAAVERGEADIGGRLPVNPSGGLIGKGHPLGGTGVAQVVELVRQLRGEAGERQIEGARVGLAHCRGGKAVGIEGAACTVQVLVK